MNTEIFLDEIAEILDEASVKESDVLTEFEAWDSLTILSIIALGSETYGKSLTNNDIRQLKTVGDLKQLFGG